MFGFELRQQYLFLLDDFLKSINILVVAVENAFSQIFFPFLIRSLVSKEHCFDFDIIGIVEALLAI